MSTLSKVGEVGRHPKKHLKTKVVLFAIILTLIVFVEIRLLDNLFKDDVRQLPPTTTSISTSTTTVTSTIIVTIQSTTTTVEAVKASVALLTNTILLGYYQVYSDSKSIAVYLVNNGSSKAYVRLSTSLPEGLNLSVNPSTLNLSVGESSQIELDMRGKYFEGIQNITLVVE